MSSAFVMIETDKLNTSGMTERRTSSTSRSESAPENALNIHFSLVCKRRVLATVCSRSWFIFQPPFNA